MKTIYRKIILCCSTMCTFLTRNSVYCVRVYALVQNKFTNKNLIFVVCRRKTNDNKTAALKKSSRMTMTTTKTG